VIASPALGAIRTQPLLRAALGRAANGIFGKLVLGSTTADGLHQRDGARGYFAGFVRFRVRRRWLPNGVEPERFLPLMSRGARHCARAWGSEKPAALAVRRPFVERRELPLLCQLAQRLPHAMIFAGWGPLGSVRWGLATCRFPASYHREAGSALPGRRLS